MIWQLPLAILCVIIASQVVGFLWYGPIFGNIWMKAMGWGDQTPEEMKEMQAGATPGYIVSAALNAAATTLMWLVLVEWDFYASMSDLHAIPAGMLLALVGWTMFYIPGTVITKFFSETQWSVIGIGAGYWLIIALLQGIFVGVFSAL